MTRRTIQVKDLADSTVGWMAHVWQADDDGEPLSLCGLPYEGQGQLVENSVPIVACEECHYGRAVEVAQVIRVHYTHQPDDGVAACGTVFADEQGFTYGMSVVLIPCGECITTTGTPMTWTVHD